VLGLSSTIDSMVNFDRSPWKNIHADLSLYRYEREDSRQVLSQAPVLMLHGPMTSHRTWDTMGDFLWQQGMSELYAVDIPDVQLGMSLRSATEHLRLVIEWILAQHPNAQLSLIGHSTGGVLARRYLRKTKDTSHICYLFSLASPHTRTRFSYKIYVPPEEDAQETRQSTIGSNLLEPSEFSPTTFIINIFGNAVGPYFDGTVHGILLPEAVNMVLPLRHAQLKQDPTVFDEVLACLRGERYRMQLYLQSMFMRTPDEDGMVGPFYFEVNGMRSPFDGIFKAEADHHYTFEENSPPLATLSYLTDQTLATTVFRLKDVSRARAVRRRLFAKLLDSLGNDETAIHEMQDNEGSRITLRVRTERMPVILSGG